MHDWFRRFAHRASDLVGSPAAFIAGLLIVLAWALAGPMFGYSNTWQLVINTGTTIVTFLMVFLIQNTQSRDARAVHLKLDELILSAEAARNEILDAENLSDEELDRLQRQFSAMRERAEGKLRRIEEHRRRRRSPGSDSGKRSNGKKTK
jgi:low affinity Fe/Cu permease